MNFVSKALVLSVTLLLAPALSAEGTSWFDKARTFTQEYVVQPAKDHYIAASALGASAVAGAAYTLIPEVKTQVNKGYTWTKKQVTAGAGLVNNHTVQPVRSWFAKLDETKLSKADGLVLLAVTGAATTAYVNPKGVTTSSWNGIKKAAVWATDKTKAGVAPVWSLINKNKTTQVGSAAAALAIPVIAYAAYRAYTSAPQVSAPMPETVQK